MSSFAVLGKGGSTIDSGITASVLRGKSLIFNELERPYISGRGAGREYNVSHVCDVAVRTSWVTDGHFRLEQSLLDFSYEIEASAMLHPMTVVGDWNVRVSADFPLNEGIVYVMGQTMIAGVPYWFTAQAQLHSISRDYPRWEAVATLRDVECSYDSDSPVETDLVALTFRSGTLETPSVLTV